MKEKLSKWNPGKSVLNKPNLEDMTDFDLALRMSMEGAPAVGNMESVPVVGNCTMSMEGTPVTGGSSSSSMGGTPAGNSSASEEKAEDAGNDDL